MSYRFILNYPKKENISVDVLDFLFSELVSSRRGDEHELWLVSPWMTDSSFDLSRRGEFIDIWSSYSNSTIKFSQIIKNFLDYDSTINIVTRTPHRLISPYSFLNYYEYKKKFSYIDELLGELKEKEEKVVEINTNSRRNKNKMIEITNELQQHIHQLRPFLNSFLHSLGSHISELELIRDIKEYGEEKVNIFYNDRLHAKILLGTYGAYIGSANITYSGFNFNDEIFLYTANEKILDELKKIVIIISKGDEWFKRKASEYSLKYEYNRVFEGNEILLKLYSDEETPKSLKEIISLLNYFE